MSLIDDFIYRQNQKRANHFIESLKKKSDKEIEQSFLNNKEFQNNEIVLSYIFFNHPSLIRILPLEFQKSRINSNLNMFSYGSDEAKKSLVISWFKDNKFFMNALVIKFSEEEYNEYLQLYFNSPDDIALLYMDDLKKTLTVLSEHDFKKTEEIINQIKDKLNDRQWEYVIEVNPSFIKYASQNVQNAHAEEDEYISFLSGSARNKYIDNQASLINDDFSRIEQMDIDVQVKYIKEHPYMINYLSVEVLSNVLKYDTNLMKYTNFNINKNKEDKTQEVVCSLLENVSNKDNKEIVNILISKCLLNAKGKLYRFDPNSNDISFQYTKRVIRALQELTINQIITLIMIDVNYILPYIVPIYNDNTDIEEKRKIIVDANSRCLNVFKTYYGEEIYNEYYKVINKIYNEYLENFDKYDFSKDYRCIFDLFKVLFNKQLIKNNNFEKVSLFIGTSLYNKDNPTLSSKQTSVKLLNELLENTYKTRIDNNKEIYNISSLELFDSKLNFINRDLLTDFAKYNFVNISNLLLITKSDKIYKLFRKYYEILIYILGENKESLYKIIENFSYYKNIIEDTEYKELTTEEINNLVLLLATYNNPCKINKIQELNNYNITLFKKLVSDLSNVKDINVYKNILCNYLYNRGYDEKGCSGWLDVDTVKQVCDVYETESLQTLVINDEHVFEEEEIKLFSMTKLLCNINDYDALLGFVNNIIQNNVKRDVLSVTELFNKLKKYRVELINNEIVSLNEIEDLYEVSKGIVTKNTKDGLNVYTVVGQDFRVLCSLKDTSEDYECVNISQLEKNVYVFDRLNKEKLVRFVSDEDKTVVKINQDTIEENNMKPGYILLVSQINDNIMNIAKSLNLDIVEIQR